MQEEDQQNYEECYQDPEYYNDFLDHQPQKKHTQQQQEVNNFQIYDRDDLIKKIQTEVKQLAQLTALNAQWAFQLYYMCMWNKNICYKLLGQNIVKKQLHYINQQVQQITGKFLCQICLQSNVLWKNPCSHRFCLNCWKHYLQLLLNYDHTLFPQCMQNHCQMKMNMKLINIILQKDYALSCKYDKVLCKSYAQLNKKVKICPNLKCDKVIYCNFYKQPALTCKCGIIICSQCGKEQHAPTDCIDRTNWMKIYNDKKNQWINIVQTKTCPHCKQPVQKNDGCNHMTCRCKGQFCWICGRVWNTHDPNYCPYRLQYQRLEEERRRRLENEKQYMLQYQATREIFDREENQLKQVKKIDIENLKNQLINNVQILNVDCLFLSDIVKFLQQSLKYIQWAAVQKFFKRFPPQLLGIQIKKMIQMSKTFDEFLRVNIPQIIHQAKRWPQSVEKNNKKFMQERKRILQLKSHGTHYLGKLLQSRSNNFGK